MDTRQKAEQACVNDLLAYTDAWHRVKRLREYLAAVEREQADRLEPQTPSTNFNTLRTNLNQSFIFTALPRPLQASGAPMPGLWKCPFL